MPSSGVDVTQNGGGRLAALRAAEAALGAVERDERRLRERTRATLGIVGRAERVPFGTALQAAGVGWFPLVALCAVAFADAAVLVAVALTTPAIRLSIGGSALGSLDVFRPVIFAAAGVGVLALLRRRGGRTRRPIIVTAAAALLAVSTAAVALATASLPAMLAALVGIAASGAAAAVVAPMIVDAHPPEVRTRAISAFAGAVLGGMAVATFFVFVGHGIGLTWRAQLLSTAVVALVAAALATRLGDPAVGRFDRASVTDLVEAELGGRGAGASDLSADHVGLTMAEELRRVVAVPSAPALLTLAAVFGVFQRSLPPFLDQALRDQWGMVAPSRGLTYGALCLAALPAVAWFGRRGEVELRIAPRRLLHLTGSAALLSAAALGVAAVAPAFPLLVGLLAVAFGGFAIMLAAATAALLALTEPARRGHAAVILGSAVVVGGLLGQSSIATIGSRFGISWAIEVAALAALAAAGALTPAIDSIDDDVDTLLARQVEVDELATRVSQGQHLPLLSCRHVDFAYGQVQVLFDVSFTVDDGEMVALLGTNGAGKSTLLRLISGLGFPTRGSIHYRGADVTFLDTDRRVQLGIAQIPGGRAVFGPMSVVDNLRVYGHTLGRDRASLDRGIDEAFTALPRLAERRNQLASTLSGGEQQMLALSKAFILKPRLLLIDELSLGLAPIVVSELLQMVRRINAEGTAVVLVEQSVNVALSVVDHAYFMEKGEMRFDGAAQELLDRPDLLRSVFLQGAAHVLDMEPAR